MVIVITYDENGGFWDHVAPRRRQAGPSTRIPAIIISPLAKKGFVDHTAYDTASVLRLVTRRFGLDALPGITARDAAWSRTAIPAWGTSGRARAALTYPSARGMASGGLDARQGRNRGFPYFWAVE